jgi:hypothetical protein
MFLIFNINFIYVYTIHIFLKRDFFTRNGPEGFAKDPK